MAEFKDITQNECNFQGAVDADPTYLPVEGGEGAFFKIRTYVPVQGAGGQWVDTLKVVPIVNINPTKTVNVIKKYVTAGKRVLVRSYYDSWKDEDGNEQNGLIMTRIDLGGGPPRNKSAVPGASG